MTLDAHSPASAERIELRTPHENEGLLVHDLVEAGGVLDTNSLYCNVLMAHHFAETSAVAVTEDELIGFVTAYIPPEQTDTLFIWQVGVDDAWRGRRLGHRLLLSILGRDRCRAVRFLAATITPSNEPSWKLFGSVARELNVPLEKFPRFDRERHFGGRHESEIEIRIGPFTGLSD